MAFKRKIIKTQQQTVGTKLKAARRKMDLTLEQAEEATKIRQKYLKAIESDNWNEFPSRIYVYGFIKKYAEFLELEGNKVLEEFKAEFGQNRPNFTPRKQESILDRIVITPKFIIWLLVTVLVAFALGYVGFSAQKISRPPEIEILSPKEDVSTAKEIIIEGKTLDTAVVEINNQLVNVDDKGYFQQKTVLNEGVNIFEIVAKSRIGKEQLKTLKILYTEKK